MNKKLNLILMIAFTLVLMMSFVSGAGCVKKISDASISCGDNNTECNFEISEELQGIKLIATSEVIDLESEDTDVEFYLCKDNTCDSWYSTETVRMVKGVAEITGLHELDASDITLSGEYTIMAIIDPIKRITNPDGLDLRIFEIITVKNALEVILSCPLEGFIDRDIICTYTVRADNQQIKTNFQFLLSVIQGTTSIDGQITNNEVLFSVPNTGSVDVQVKVSTEEFLDGEALAIIEVNHPTNNEDLFIDKIDFFDLSDGAIDIGTHELSFKMDKGGEPIAVNNINVNIISPGGAIDKLTFNKVSESEYKTTFNFLQKGQTYTLRGEIDFQDTGEDSLLVNYNIRTKGDITAPYKKSFIWGIIGISVGILAVIIILFFLFRKGKK